MRFICPKGKINLVPYWCTSVGSRMCVGADGAGHGDTNAVGCSDGVDDVSQFGFCGRGAGAGVLLSEG